MADDDVGFPAGSTDDREWTDHNASDPGITLLQLFAYLAESFLSRVSDAASAVWRRLTARCD